MGTEGVVIAVPLGLRRNTFRCFLAYSEGSVKKSKLVVVQGAMEMSIWPTRSSARIDLSNSLIERGVSRVSVGSEDDIVISCTGSWS